MPGTPPGHKERLMKFLKKLVLVSALALLVAADSHARPRLLGRRTCVSPAPVRVVRVTTAPQYQTIPAPAVPVPTIPPQTGPVVMPTTGLLALPSRVVQTVCSGGVCGAR
jgi:hypothetical protein